MRGNALSTRNWWRSAGREAGEPFEPIEVGCRGFAGRSLCKVLSRLGITGVAKKRAIQSASEAAEKATRWLWIKRADPWSATGMQVGA